MLNDVKGMDILKKLGFGTMRLPVDENEDINYELIGQMVDIFVRNGFTYFDKSRRLFCVLWYCLHSHLDKVAKSM